MNRLKNMPVPVLPAFVGALTLGNVYGGLGYTWLRHLTMWTAVIVLLLYLVKIIRFTGTVLEEYKAVVPSSLYAGFFMCVMILGGYFYDYVPALGRTMVLAAVACHAVHIAVFTTRNLIQKRNINTFMPSWFVTYNGIMVSCVVGSAMGITPILNVVLYYGILVYLCIIPFMIWRLMTVTVSDAVYHTMAVVLAPCSLCVVSYINVSPNPNPYLLYFLYFCVLASLGFIIVKLPKFFRYSFTPGFAGLTFPMAIGIVATTKMSGYLAGQGLTAASAAAAQLSGFQIYLTTMLVGYVMLNFVIMALRIERK